MDEKILRKNIADNIRQLRAKQRISQEMLSEKTGISQQSISCIENEHYNPSILTLMRIARAFNVALDDLVF